MLFTLRWFPALLCCIAALADTTTASADAPNQSSGVFGEVPGDELPAGVVVCDIRENVRADDPWNRADTQITMQWEQPVAAVPYVPKKYAAGAVIVDRTSPWILRLRCRAFVPPGEWQLLARARSQSRLLVNGQEVATLIAMQRNASGHEQVPELSNPVHQFMHPLPAGNQEVLTTTVFDGTEPHVFEFETVVGGKGVRLEAGETLLAIARAGEEFRLLAPSGEVTATRQRQRGRSPSSGLRTASPSAEGEGRAQDFPAGGDGRENGRVVGGEQGNVVALDEASWRSYATQHQHLIRELERRERQRQDADSSKYWSHRHKAAAQLATAASIDSPHQIDGIIAARIQEEGLQPTGIVDDLRFLKRLTLSTIGVIPSVEEITWFRTLPEETRREKAVDRFLADDRWADHWVAYWQDVLAENPGILKPMLNNTGPFRWWIYESLLDNKPTDRFATELTLMEGSKLGGAAAGFAMATQNDVPMAARALVLSTAFNARDMKCSRCHDSPVREFEQQELFQLAALLNRAPLEIPDTSSVPIGPDGERPSAITVSIEPGATIAPRWPFEENDENDAWYSLVKSVDDPREKFALHLTHPTESPFAQVMVNRLWARLFGRGIVTNLDDWSSEAPTYPELLDGLAIQHIHSRYDLKSTARIILLSEAWQREAVPAESELAALAAAPAKQRLTAEQMVDSLYAAVGKSFGAEMLTLDPEGRRPASTFLNLGVPDRAWQFCGLSNERDRPALALPVAQGLVDLLSVFGWRESRPHTMSEREHSATVLQALTLQNGNAGHRLIQLSDGASTTEICVNATSPDALVDALFLQLLAREASTDERKAFASAIADGFHDRIVPGAKVRTQPKIYRNAVSWSNHLNSEATRIKMQLEEDARNGDPPTERLSTEWRRRAEDVVWVLMNSPEFAFVP